MECLFTKKDSSINLRRNKLKKKKKKKIKKNKTLENQKEASLE